MDSRNFFKDIRPLSSFAEATNTVLHTPLPPDWWLVVADVQGSTPAIEAGRYKDVNTVGAATIMAVINVDRTTEIPYVFGGDGATLAVPPHMVDGTRAALLASQKMAKEGFNLDLRVGMLPTSDVLSQDLWLGVGKYWQSKNLVQTSLSGFGWVWAESTVKHPTNGQKYLVKENDKTKPFADFTGFECRWKPVKARNGSKLAIIIQSTLKKGKEHAHVYENALNEISKIYGDVSNYHPLNQDTISLSNNPLRLMGEAIVKATKPNLVTRTLGALKLAVTSVIGSLAFKFDLKILGVRWGKYRKEVVENADFRKFDGALKMVIDGSAAQESKLTEYLENRRQAGELIYGIHSSQYAIMTCLVFTPGQDHAHFVDGSDGGYALAAKMLKTQVLNFKSKSPQRINA